MRGSPFWGVAPHFYIPPRSPADGGLGQSMLSQVAYFRDRRFKGPLWITEIGWHCDDTMIRQQFAADCLVQSYTLALAAGFEKVFWYNFVCDTPDKAVSEYGLLNRADLSPKISYAAFAGLVRQLEGCRYVRPLAMPRNVTGHLFAEPDGTRCAVVWADRGRGDVELGNGRVRLSDMYANSMGTTSAIPLTRSPHFVRTEAGDLGTLLERGVVRGLPPVEVRLLPTTGSLRPGSQVAIVVANAARSDIVARIRVRCDWGEVEAPDAISIPGAGETTVSLRVRDFRANRENQYPLQVETEVRGGGSVSTAFMLCQKIIPRGTVVVDGDLAEWADALPHHLNEPSQVVGISPWMDWNLSAVYYMKWNPDGLAFAARVRDNVHCQPHTGETIWEGDSWQLGFAPRSWDSTRKSAACLGFALGSSGPLVASWQDDKATNGIRLAVKKVEHLQTPASPGGPSDESELIYEALIPWDRLGGGKPVPGMVVRLSVLLNDNDGGGRAGWLESTPGIGTGFDPNRFDYFELQ